MSHAHNDRTPTPAPVRRRRSGGQLTKDGARQLLSEHSRIGGTLAAFARSKGLTPGQLGYWAKKLGPPTAATQAPAPTVATFVPVTVARTMSRGSRPHSATPPRATPAAIAPTSFDLVLSVGRTLRIPADFEPAALARVLRVLAEAP